MYFPFEKRKLEEQICKLAQQLGENVSLRSLKCLTQYFSLSLVPKLISIRVCLCLNARLIYS